MRARDAFRLGAVGLFCLVSLGLLGIEAAYKVGLRNAVGVLPRVPTAGRMSRVHLAMWAAEGGGTMEVEPIRAWTVAGRVARAVWRPMQRPRAPGLELAGLAARSHLFSRPRRGTHLDWHLSNVCLSIWLSRHATAEQLVSLHVESAYFGRATFGARAAARAYFDAPPEALDWSQAALLAGLRQSPTRNDPWCNPERATRRRRFVLERLAASGVISEATRAAASTAPLEVLPTTCPPGRDHGWP